eukprot:evm.model.NODE_8295_length_19219_cov_26.868359.6
MQHRPEGNARVSLAAAAIITTTNTAAAAATAAVAGSDTCHLGQGCEPLPKRVQQ